MAQTNRIGAVANTLFTSALLINKLGQLTIPAIAHLTFIVSTLLYLLAYTLWNYSIRDEDTIPQNCDAKIRCELIFNNNHIKSYRYATYFGIVASILGLFSLLSPIVAMVSAWLFLVSNAYWCYAESRQHTRFDCKKPCSLEEKIQRHYLYYAATVTFIGLISACALSLSIAVPTLALSLASAVFPCLIALNLFAFFHFYCARKNRAQLNKYNETEDLEHPYVQTSYSKLNEELGASQSLDSPEDRTDTRTTELTSLPATPQKELAEINNEPACPSL